MILQILSLLLAAIVTRVLWRRWNYDLHKIPSPPGLPLLGHTLQFMNGQPSYQLSQWVGSCLKQMGNPKLMRVEIMGDSWLFVTDLDFIKNVMLSKTSPFPSLDIVGEIYEPLLGPSVVGSRSMLTILTPTPYVKAVRRIYTSAFQTSNLKTAMSKLDKVMVNLIKAIESTREGGPIDVQPLFVKMGLDAIGVVAFDSNLGGLDGSGDAYDLLLKAGYIARDRLVNPLKKIYVKCFPNSKEGKRQNAVINALAAEWDKLTKEILERDDPPNGEEPMWHGLRNLKDPETNKPILDKRLLNEIATVVVGGMDSTGFQLAWIFVFLASHPHVVEKLLEELGRHDLCGTNSKEVTFEDLGELTYLTAIIKEGMRLGYIADVLPPRTVPKNMSILSYRVPKGTVIVAPGTRAMESEEMWGDPHKFRPERWTEGEEMSQKYTLGFSTGPRDCVGQRLAMLEMRLAIIKLVTRYEFKLEGNWEDLMESAKDGIVIEAKDGVWIDFTPRASLSHLSSA